MKINQNSNSSSLLAKNQLHIIAISQNGETSGYTAYSQKGGRYCREETIGKRGLISTEDNSDFPYDYLVDFKNGKLTWEHKTEQVTPQLPKSVIRSYFTTWANNPCSLKQAIDADFVRINGVTIGECALTVVAIARASVLDGNGELMTKKLPERAAVIVQTKRGGVVLDGICKSKNPHKDWRLLLHGLPTMELIDKAKKKTEKVEKTTL